MTTTYRISQLAERVRVPATTRRFCEKEGLLVTGRSPDGYRRYGEADAERVRFISAAERPGLPLDRIRDLLQVWDGGMRSERRDELRPTITRQIADTDRRSTDLAALAVAEQRCRPFLTIRIALIGTDVELEAHAPAVAEPLVAALLAEADRAGVSC